MSIFINISKRKKCSINFKSNIIKEVDKGLLNNQELCKIHDISPSLLSKSLEK